MSGDRRTNRCFDIYKLIDRKEKQICRNGEIEINLISLRIFLSIQGTPFSNDVAARYTHY